MFADSDKWNAAEKKRKAQLSILFCIMADNFTIAHREPEVVARTVAALGMLYISASSPKLPEPVYLPTSFSVPSSLDTVIENVPLFN